MRNSKFNSVKLACAALAFGSVVATGASAATIDFSSAGTGAAGAVAGGPLTYTSSASASGFLNNGAVVTVSSNGLGVNGNPDLNPEQIDGSPNFSSETLTITFSWAVNLVDFTLGLLDSNDDYEVSFNGGTFSHYGPGLVNPMPGQNYVSSFSVRATGAGIFQDGLFGNDNFTLASANVSPVPLPAAGFLLLGAMGGLAALRRRKGAAAA
jgi:hypothetical protein